MINVIDEVLDGEELFYITPKKDQFGNTVYKIELATRVETPGTPHNKALFDSIDYDIKNIPNFIASESYTDIFNSGTTKTKTIQLSNNRFFMIKTFIDESFVSPSYRYTQQGVAIFDAKTKQFLFYYAPYLGTLANGYKDGVRCMNDLSLVLYRQGQQGGSRCELKVDSFDENTREITIQISASGASNAQITWTFEVSSLDGKF